MSQQQEQEQQQLLDSERDSRVENEKKIAQLKKPNSWLLLQYTKIPENFKFKFTLFRHK